VDVSVHLETLQHNTIVLRVQDRGAGIPRSELKRVFKRFYRVRTRSVKQVKGTGLGLFIVRSIARKHGGNVYAESEGEGRGTTITLRLPRSAAS
jgi:two-component system, OmpR family, sensor histidine kinase SenX3